ncbi:PKD domain-containing protein, partial [bacterium]|nr:PKD domain-containing protein [bacterium]
MKKIVFFFWLGIVALLPTVFWGEGAFAQSKLNFDASPTIGAPPLFVQLSCLTEIEEGDFYWEISDGRTLNGRRPVLRFEEAGSYTVKLTVTSKNCVYALTQQNMITVYSDSMTAGLCHLELVDHSHTWVGETWDNAIDGDTYNKNGTVTAGRDPAFAIFQFSGGGFNTINKVRLLEKTFINGNSNNWLKRFRILVARDGYYQHHF